MRRCSSVCSSLHRLEVRLHDTLDAAEPREAEDVARLRPLRLEAESQALHCDVDADLVSETKTVRHRLRRRVDLHVGGTQLLHLDALGERFLGEAKDPNRWLLELGRLRPASQRYPDLVRHFGRDLVECERGDEAHDPLWDPKCHCHQIGLLERLLGCETKDAAAERLEDAGVPHLVEDARVDPEVERLLRVKNSAVHPKDALRAPNRAATSHRIKSTSHVYLCE